MDTHWVFFSISLVIFMCLFLFVLIDIKEALEKIAHGLEKIGSPKREDNREDNRGG